MAGCIKCDYQGRVYQPLIEDYVACECQLSDYEVMQVDSNDDFFSVDKKDDKIVEKVIESREIVCKRRLDDNFSISVMDERSKERNVENRAIKNYDKYRASVSFIMSHIMSGTPFNRSFLLIAPNGMSKTTMANTCIKALAKQGKKVVPLISLLELNDLQLLHKVNMGYVLKVSQIDAIADSIKSRYDDGEGSKVVKKEVMETIKTASIAHMQMESRDSQFRYKEYVTADVVFLKMLACADIFGTELQSLYQLLDARGRRGLPTIVLSDILSWDLKMNIDGNLVRIYRSIISDAKHNGTDILYKVECYV